MAMIHIKDMIITYRGHHDKLPNLIKLVEGMLMERQWLLNSKMKNRKIAHCTVVLAAVKMKKDLSNIQKRGKIWPGNFTF